MKNKMMKTAGLLLASTTMLMANSVVASESIQDKSCEVKVMEDGQAIKFMVNHSIEIITAGLVEEAFNIETKCKSEAVAPNTKAIATSNPKPHPLAKVFGDNNSEVTTFTSEDTERPQKHFIENNDGQLCYGTEKSCNEQFNEFDQDILGDTTDTIIDENKEARIAETERWIILDLNNSLNIIDINEKATFRTERKGRNITHHIESKEKKNFNIGNYELITTRDRLSNTNPEDWNLNQYKALEQSINFNLNGKKEIWINEKDGFIALREIRGNTVQTDIIYQSKPTEDGTKITVTRTKLL